VGVSGLAVAAVIVIVLLLPPSLVLNVEVETQWPRATRGDEIPPTDDPRAFTVRVSTNKTTFVHLIALMESGDLLIKQVAPEEERPVFSRRVEEGDDLGEYPLWYDPEDEPDRGLLRTTHIMVVAAGEPIVEQLADPDNVPDRIAVESAEDALRKLEELGRNLERQLGCVVVVKPIPSSAP
jgi:hypothetical protein